MKELGKILREKREELGLDLEKVHRSTKIQEKYITAIEEGDKAEFTAEIYYKSFVKSYSKFLGLNGDDLLGQYEKRKCDNNESDNVDKPGKNSCKSKTLKASKERNNDLKKLFVTVLIAGVLCAAFLYLNKNISILTDDNPDKISVTEQKNIQLQKIQELQQQKQEQAQEQKEQALREISIAEQEVKIEENKNKVLKPFPQNQNTQVLTSAPNPSVVTEQVSKNTASLVKQPREKQELVIKAVENVWIMVEGDSREIFQGTIVKGTKKTWNANEEFVVKIGYTPGVDVFFNGIEINIDKGAVQDVNTLVLKRQQ